MKHSNLDNQGLTGQASSALSLVSHDNENLVAQHLVRVYT